MRTTARFPAVAAGAGHYESFYAKAAHPGGGRAVWLRHTVHKRPGAEPEGSLWLTIFDASAAGPRAVKATYPASELQVPTGEYVRIGEAAIAPGHARGSISAPLDASWKLDFVDEGEAFFHLPYQRLYRTALPKTKLLSPHPQARFSGSVELDGETVELDGWPGMVGHNWGAEHAERWIWIQAGDLGGQSGSCFDLAAGRIRVGPFTSPWVANGMLRIDGAEHRLGGLDRVLRTTIDEEPTSCSFELGGDGLRVKGRVAAEPRDFVAWIYADPDGPEHNTLNCSISDLELELERADGEPERLEVAGAAAYELGMRETDHGIPLQPYPDG